MFNKVQFTVQDLNTMYAAGILDTRESLGFGKNFKKANVEAPNAEKDTKKGDPLVKTSAALISLLEELLGETKSGGNSSNNKNKEEGEASTSANFESSSSPVSTSGKASSGTPAEAKNISKATSAAGSLLGGPLGSLLGLGLGKAYEMYQNSANADEGLAQQKALDNLINNIQNKDSTLDSLLADLNSSAQIDMSGGSVEGETSISDSESRSNSQGF